MCRQILYSRPPPLSPLPPPFSQGLDARSHVMKHEMLQTETFLCAVCFSTLLAPSIWLLLYFTFEIEVKKSLKKFIVDHE